jgi:coproporphyrinogen III oxidase-like Fe-S oxidoreductase
MPTRIAAAWRFAGTIRWISLYFHIPFCNTICYYCACNKIITKDHGRSAKYLKYLAKELALQSSYLDPEGDNVVEQLHWGGGTPTFLSHDEMRQLMAATRKHFRLSRTASIRSRSIRARSIAPRSNCSANSASTA